MNAPFKVGALVALLFVPPAARAALVYSADFNSYSVGATPTINATGSNNTFSNLSDAGTLGTLTVQAAASPYSSQYVSLARGAAGTAGNLSFSQTKIVSLSVTNSVFIYSFDINRGSQAANPQLAIQTGAGATIAGSNITLSSPPIGTSLWRATYIYNGSGSSIVLPGSVGTLLSGNAAAYVYDGTTFTLENTMVTITDTAATIGGLNIRTNLSGGRLDNFDNIGAWTSASDTYNGVSVLQLAPGTAVPEPTVPAMVGLAILGLGVRRLIKGRVR